MANAITKASTSISGSSLTTVAGFIALCAMDLALGRHFGIESQKGLCWSFNYSYSTSSLITFDKVIHNHTQLIALKRLQIL